MISITYLATAKVSPRRIINISLSTKMYPRENVMAIKFTKMDNFFLETDYSQRPSTILSENMKLLNKVSQFLWKILYKKTVFLTSHREAVSKTSEKEFKNS